MICSGAEGPVDVALSLDPSRHPDAQTRLIIEGAAKSETVALEVHATPVELRVSVPPGATRFSLRTEGAPANDGRVLAFQTAGRPALASAVSTAAR